MATGVQVQSNSNGKRRRRSRQVRDAAGEVSAAARWRGLLRAWRASGLSQSAFCRERGLSPQTFSTWKGKLARRAALPEAAGAPAFVPVRVVGAAGAARDGGEFEAVLEVVLAGGRRIRVGRSVDAVVLATVVRVLEGAGAC